MKALHIMGQIWTDLIFLGFIVGITIITWHGILNQTIEGEGFYYFSPVVSNVLYQGRITDIITGFDTFPRVASILLQNTFNEKLEFYMGAQLLTILFIYITFYVFVKVATGKGWVAFLATTYAAVYYTGNFQLYARGHFQWFLQRVPETIPVFVSLSFLVKYIDSRKIISYLASLFFFILALSMSHYTMIIFPVIPFLLFMATLLKTKNKKEAGKFILLIFPFAAITYLIISNTSLPSPVIRHNQTFGEFLSSTPDLFQKISHQLVVTTVPFGLLKFLHLKFDRSYQELISSLRIPVYMFYIFGFWLLYKRKFPALYVSVACFLALLTALFLTVYLNRVANVYDEIEQGRYYYLPGFYVGIILATFINNLWSEKKVGLWRKTFKVSVILLLVILWVTVNTSLIWKKMKDTQKYYDQSKSLFTYLSNKKDQLPKEAVVLFPSPPGPNSVDFLKKYYGAENTNFIYLDEKWLSRIPPNINPQKLFVLTYAQTKNVEPPGVVDISEEYRKILKVTRQEDR